MRAAGWIAAAVVALAGSGDGAMAAPKVAATIAPIHSLAARVMEGVGEPRLLIQPGASPHHYSMRPSEASSLAEADLVFWVGESLELWLAGPIETLAGHAKTVALEDAPGLTTLELREGGGLEGLAHVVEAARRQETGEEDSHHHAETGRDPHLWLDPENAKAMLSAIAEALAEVDPENAERYRANAEAARAETDALIAEIADRLAPVRDRPFIVFHDAYSYFERRFGVSAAGAIALSEADAPGPARVVKIRARLAETGAVCVFTEPQFTPKLANAIIEGTGARLGVLDPIGADIAPGPALYPTLIRNLAASLAECLSK